MSCGSIAADKDNKTGEALPQPRPHRRAKSKFNLRGLLLFGFIPERGLDA